MDIIFDIIFTIVEFIFKLFPKFPLTVVIVFVIATAIFGNGIVTGFICAIILLLIAFKADNLHDIGDDISALQLQRGVCRISVAILVIHFITSSSIFSSFFSIVGFVVAPISFLIALNSSFEIYDRIFNKEKYRENVEFRRKVEQYGRDRTLNRMNETVFGDVAKDYNRKNGW